MTRSAMWMVLILLPGVAWGSDQHAQLQFSTTSVAAVPAGFVAVPFAVPVAMPSYVQYQALGGFTTAFSQYAYLPSSAQRASACASCATKAPAADEVSSTRATQLAPEPSTTTIVAAQCGRCHGAVQAKAGLDLTAELDEATRLKAISRLLADDPRQRMPKGKELPPELRGQLIQELARPATPRPAPALEE